MSQAEAVPAPLTPFLSFRVAGGEYGVPLTRVREVLRVDALTRVPSTHGFIRGVMNVRGQVLPIIDLAVKLALPERPLTRFSCVVVVETELSGERTPLGLLADAVSQLVELEAAQIERTPSFGVPVKLEFLTGVGVLGPRLVLLLDLDRVLSTEELMGAVAVGGTAR